MSSATSPFQACADGTLSQLLRDLAAHRGAAPALMYPAFVHGGAALRLSFAELDARVDAMARGLLHWGVAPGDRVALWAANLPDWIPLEFALARVGAVLVTVNTALAPGEVAYVLRQSRSRFVIHATRTGSTEASASLDALLADPAAPLAGLAGRAWIPALPGERAPAGRRVDGSRGPLVALDDLVAAGAALPVAALRQREAATRPGDLVNIQYTSGTTGFPKGVMLSHGNILGSAAMLGEQVRMGGDDRTLLMVPLFHCFGCVVVVLGSFVYGASLCCLPAFDAAHALRLIHEERCTVIFGVPTMFSALLADPSRPSRDTTSLRTGFVAGAPCPPSLVERIVSELHCAAASVGYGLTECSPGVSGCNPEDGFEQRSTTVGRALPGVSVRIVDPATLADRPDGEEGELLVSGPNVMLGYHDDPVATAAALVDGRWLRTGDLAVRRADGCLRIVGRAKDIIIRGGENIAPAEVENLLREHPDVVDAAVVGTPDPYYGEEVAAALVLRAGTALDPAAYLGLLKGRVAPFKLPKRWLALERLPLTGSGKVQKFKLREEFARRTGGGTAG